MGLDTGEAQSILTLMTTYALPLSADDTHVATTTVLVADDDPSVRRLLRLALELEGFEVITVADGDAAWEAARAQRPEAVILDAVMPGTDGGEVCRRIRSELGWSVTVVMLTGQREVLSRVSAFDNGADDYLEKPARVAEVVKRVKGRLTAQALRSDRLLVAPELHEELGRRVQLDEPVAVTLARLRGIRLFADRYGFERADALLAWFGGLVSRTAEIFPRGRAGRLGTEDFLGIVLPENADDFADCLRHEFGVGIARWYDTPDAERGCIEVRDRAGHVRRSRFVQLSTGIAANRPDRVHHFELLEQAATNAEASRRRSH
jgi:DNA-binding response OmpR family regulator